MDVAADQSRRLASICATQYTMPWDTFTDPGDVPCSIPCSSSTWTEISVCERKRTGDRDPPPCLSLSNRFEPLANTDSPVPPATSLVVANAVPTPQVNNPGAADDPSQQRATSRHKMLRNAVISRSGGGPVRCFPWVGWGLLWPWTRVSALGWALGVRETEVSAPAHRCSRRSSNTFHSPSLSTILS